MSIVAVSRTHSSCLHHFPTTFFQVEDLFKELHPRKTFAGETLDMELAREMIIEATNNGEWSEGGPLVRGTRCVVGLVADKNVT